MNKFFRYIARLTFILLLLLCLLFPAVTAILLFYPHYLWYLCRPFLIAAGAGIGLFCIATSIFLLLHALSFFNKKQKISPPS